MADKTRIEWTDATWNPVTGCTKVSPGCAHCYAETMTKRFGGDFSTVQMHSDRFGEPLHWRKSRRIFVCSMSDLFQDAVPVWARLRVFNTMALAEQHTFMLLTKRPDRMQVFLTDNPMAHLAGTLKEIWESSGKEWRWPLPNVWLGVSVENQRAAEERIPLLLQTPAALRFVSCEPLLEAVDIAPFLYCQQCPGLSGHYHTPTLDWVIAGGESGPKARPAQREWFRALRDDCHVAGVPIFIKQLGSVLGRDHGCRDRKGGDMNAWPEGLRVRQYPGGDPL